MLDECWRPAFARSLVPKLCGLVRDLEAYLAEYNGGRPHRTPHPRADPVTGPRRSAQDEAAMTAMRRYMSEAVQVTLQSQRNTGVIRGHDPAVLRYAQRQGARRVLPAVPD
jgi:hypothetical protein